MDAAGDARIVSQQGLQTSKVLYKQRGIKHRTNHPVAMLPESHVFSNQTPSNSMSDVGNAGGTESGIAESLQFDIGQQVVFTDGQVSDMARIKSRASGPDSPNRRKSLIKIEFLSGTTRYVHQETLSRPRKVDPVVNKVIGILNLREATDEHIRAQYPTLKEFEDFFEGTTQEIRKMYKRNGKKWKEPLFKRSDTEEFVILSRWIEANEDEGGKINWDLFTKESFNDFRKQAPKNDLVEVLKELGLFNDKVVKTLEDNNVQTPAHFVQKPKSWFEKLGTEENSNALFNATEKHAIEKFKEWYSYRFVGYLPSDWILTFRNDDVRPSERELRMVMREIGLPSDAVRSLKMNGIRDITALNRASKDWRTEIEEKEVTESGVNGDEDGEVPASAANRFFGKRDDEELESCATEWKLMGLTRNDASDIICFRHWYKFYVSGKKYMRGWAANFNSAHYRTFIQRYEPGDHFRHPGIWVAYKDRLRLSQEQKDYYDLLEKTAKDGDVSEEQRYHLLQSMEKREKMELIQNIKSQHDEGLGGKSLQVQESKLKELLHRDEEEYDEKLKRDLLFYQQFCQFFFSALLVLVLLASWTLTTAFLMRGNLAQDEGINDNEYLTFIHNVVFGLVTSVVIQELGEESRETSLYYRFLDTYLEQVRRSAEYRYRNQVSLRGCRGQLKRGWYLVLEFGKTRLMAVVLWSTRLYIIFWIILGAISLAFGVIRDLDTSNTLYTTGQTWLGIAVTIGYAYFGLSGKNTPKAQPIKQENDQEPNANADDAHQNSIDEGGGSTNDAGATDLEAKFTDQDGKAKVLKTRYELMKDIDTYIEMKEQARENRNFKDAAGYQKCLEQLDKLKSQFPTVPELEKQLREAEAKMNAAADEDNFDSAEKFRVSVAELQEKIRGEQNGEEMGPGGDSNV